MVDRQIILAERRVIIKKCDDCSAFRRAKLFGFVPAYCSEEGRIIESGIEYAPFDLNIQYVRHPIPKWCSLQEVPE